VPGKGGSLPDFTGREAFCEVPREFRRSGATFRRCGRDLAGAAGDFANAAGIWKLFGKLFHSRRDVARCGEKKRKLERDFSGPVPILKVCGYFYTFPARLYGFPPELQRFAGIRTGSGQNRAGLRRKKYFRRQPPYGGCKKVCVNCHYGVNQLTLRSLHDH